MVPTGEEFTVDCDLVLIAAGFTGCEPYVADAFGVERTKRGTVADVSTPLPTRRCSPAAICAAARALSSGAARAATPLLSWMKS